MCGWDQWLDWSVVWSLRSLAKDSLHQFVVVMLSDIAGADEPVSGLLPLLTTYVLFGVLFGGARATDVAAICGAGGKVLGSGRKTRVDVRNIEFLVHRMETRANRILKSVACEN